MFLILNNYYYEDTDRNFAMTLMEGNRTRRHNVTLIKMTVYIEYKNILIFTYVNKLLKHILCIICVYTIVYIC